MSRYVVVCLAAALAGLTLTTSVSLLGAWSPVADAFAHLRMHMAAAALLIAAAAVLLDPRVALAGVLLALVNVGSSLAYDRAPQAVGSGGPGLKVMTVNVLYTVDNDDQIVAQIEAERPDVVLFQELTRKRRRLLERLEQTYPWQVSCGGSRARPLAGPWPCDVAIVSRLRWEASAAEPVGSAFTKFAWARFNSSATS